ncbi:hypothetical protein E4U56_006609 [Claviceps arundinis]|uniref:Pentatricopeptide repeat domain-containing protein n=1 Tax=Claviceps arundinis TaxID=1623583 RepID=A0A9P7SRT1_9HYPO|nr:hypothetical protein E4U56_006609 [Claviceps arundinis]
MQSLWARVGQARHCGCRACSTATGGIGRRATGVAGRRRATLAEIVTACYSSIFATAAVVDAIRKDDRRKELDRQLDEARKELSDLRERSPNTVLINSPSSKLTIDQMDDVWGTLKGIYRRRPYMKEIHQPATITASELISSLNTDFYNAVSETSLRAMRQIDYEQLERDLETEEVDKNLVFRVPLNEMHIQRDSAAMHQVVQKLLRRVEESLGKRATQQSPTFVEAQLMAAEGRTNYSYPFVNPVRAAENSTILNRRIRALASAEYLDLGERIGRICYNLLVSAYPPDTHTYNTLIVAFDKHGHHLLSDVVVRSFFFERLLRPTPSTFTAIMNHYKTRQNHGQFLRCIARVSGVDTVTGAKVRRRHTGDVAQWPLLQTWAADRRIQTRTGRWHWEHSTLSTKLVETMLVGLLHFKLFSDAATLFLSCVRSGISLSTKSMAHVFDECISALDWRAAVQMIRGLMYNLQEWKTLLSQIDEVSAAYLLGRASALIDLCGLGNTGQRGKLGLKRLQKLGISLPHRTQFLEYMAEAKLLFPSKEAAGFQTLGDGGCEELRASKRRLLQLESLLKECEYIRKRTHSIESKLLKRYFPTWYRIPMASFIGATAIQRSMELSHEMRQVLGPIDLSTSRRRPRVRAKKVAKDDASLRDDASLSGEGPLKLLLRMSTPSREETPGISDEVATT